MIRLSSAYLAHDNKIIFKNLGLDIQTNEKVLILGKSGMGKTTLFKVLLGFKLLDKGEVFINNTQMTKENRWQIRNQIFYLSQDVDLKNARVKGLLDEIQESRHLNFAPEAMADFMDLLDLGPGFPAQNIKDLSGGERQRLGLLIGFLLDRPIWLLDEPTAALDDSLKKKVAGYILNQDKTIIITSHDDVWKQSLGDHSPIRIVRWG